MQLQQPNQQAARSIPLLALGRLMDVPTLACKKLGMIANTATRNPITWLPTIAQKQPPFRKIVRNESGN